MRTAAAIRPLSQEAAAMGILARCLAKASGDRQAALARAEAEGAPPSVLRVLKSPVPAGGTSDADLAALAAAGSMTTAFVGTLIGESVFYSLLADGLVRVPLRTRVGAVSANATAFIAGEGAAVPVSRLGLSGVQLDPRKANALVVLTREMLDASGHAGGNLLVKELRRAVTSAVDAAFLDIIVDDDTPTTSSSGPDAADAVTDLRWLLARVTPKASSRLMWAMAADVARGASTLMTLTGSLIFPQMSPTGGRMLNIDALASDELAPGTLALIDATGIAGESEAITLKASRDTTILMDSEPDMDATTPTAAEMVSMFQTFSVATMATAWFGAERFRDNAVAVVNDVAWTGAAS